MKIFVNCLLFLFLGVYLVLIVMFGIDAEIARRDFESGKVVQNCMFDFICERYVDSNV